MSDAAWGGTELTGAQARHVDEACNRFEDAWRAGARPRIEDHLGGDAAAAPAPLVRELVALDVYYRRRAGEALAADDYRGRFPGLDPDWLAAVLGAGGNTPV